MSFCSCLDEYIHFALKYNKFRVKKFISVGSDISAKGPPFKILKPKLLLLINSLYRN